MNTYEIQDKIRSNELMIDQRMEKIERLNQQIAELEMLKAKFCNLQERFAEKQMQRKIKLGNLSGLDTRIRIARSYTEGMNELLNGAEYQRSYQGLAEGIRRINWQIDELEEKINCLRNEMKHLSMLNSYLDEEMRCAEESEAY